MLDVKYLKELKIKNLGKWEEIMKNMHPDEWRVELQSRNIMEDCKHLKNLQLLEEEKLEEYKSRLQNEDGLCNICRVEKIIIFKNVNIYHGTLGSFYEKIDIGCKECIMKAFET